MIIKDEKQIEDLRQSGRILAEVLQAVIAKAGPGVSAYDLDAMAEKEIRRRGGNPAFKNYKPDSSSSPYPGSLCVSVNNEIVHGLPKKTKILRDGDIVTFDLGVEYRGLFTDSAITVPIGKVDKRTMTLIDVTRQSLENAIKVIKAGTYIGNIGHAIESTAKYYGFSVVRELVGHGVGAAVHEDPEIPCFGLPGTGPQLKEGSVIAVEPMVNMGKWPIMFDKDGWTAKTKDGSVSAHFEHTLMVTKTGCEIITKI